MKRAVTITVNGVSHTTGVEPRTLLVHFLREHLNLTGTHVGCDTSNCENGDLHPVQRAFNEEHGLQCGYCTPGMVMTAIKLLEANPAPSDAEIRRGLEGNLCRCTGYENIVAAVRSAAGVAV